MTEARSEPALEEYFLAMAKLGGRGVGPAVFPIDTHSVDAYQWIGAPLRGLYGGGDVDGGGVKGRGGGGGEDGGEGGGGGVGGGVHLGLRYDQTVSGGGGGGGGKETASGRAQDPCGGVDTTAHPADAALRAKAPTKPPALTVIFVTKRPGGYDVLLNSLKVW